jgi:type II secretory pathway predicted ATPase ExeA
MYNTYFGFSESPFEINLDQRFLFLCEDHTEVLAALLYFVKEKKGLALVCGDVGTGKTMLINSFLARLPDTVKPILISNPLVSYLDLLHFIAGALGINDKKENILELIEQIKGALLAARKEGKNFVLIVDEAHLFPDASLEQVRLLSNIEIPKGKLLQILLVGQYELSHKLNHPDMRQLRQRINISRFLSPLTPKETVAYIDHRLQRVGASFTSCFEPECEGLLYQLTAGLPRRINQLCDNALLHCMAEGVKKVNRQVLQKAHEALLTDTILTPTNEASPPHYKASWKIGKLLIAPAACAVFLVFGIILGQCGFWDNYLKKRPVEQILKSTETSKSEVPPLPASVEKKIDSEENKTDIAGTQAENTEVLRPKPGGEIQPDAQEPESSQPSSDNPDSPEGEARAMNLPQLEQETSAGQTISDPQIHGQTAEPRPELADEVSPLPSERQENLSSPTEYSGTDEAEVQPSSAASSPANSSRFIGEVIVKENDTLTKIAAKWSPKNIELGLVAILLANPETTNVDLILPGQKLNLPLINSADNSISIGEKQFFAVYGRYDSKTSLSKILSYLSREGVRHLVVKTKNDQGNVTHRVLIGGYENRSDLEEALTRIKARSG